MTIALTVLVVWGFASSFFLRGLIPLEVSSYLDDTTLTMRWLYVIHGTAFAAWMALLLTQAGLVTADPDAVRSHREPDRVAARRPRQDRLPRLDLVADGNVQRDAIAFVVDAARTDSHDFAY